ncbi:hypothetical protein IEO21_06012 [Rhodonia placenta]|uniref:GST C-terminal domain-containing protein n=1 Tax=Rhodonia placenta TaxID=104341 RepID=A0A8H7P0X8_9APHY|nr:hypothetical protein IEO21_06012 [Postia placenta]
MSHGKHFRLYTNELGPNGWKVVVLEAFGLTYETVTLDFSKQEQKSPEYTRYNPNGRIPTFIDHKNGDFVVWYATFLLKFVRDPKRERSTKIYRVCLSSVKRVRNVQDGSRKVCKAYMVSPYYGQGGWFRRSHPEKVPSALERYQNEALRILSMLESVLSKQEWLVRNKCTIADLSFVAYVSSLAVLWVQADGAYIRWNIAGFALMIHDYKEFNLEKDFPAVHRWHTAMLTMEPVREAHAKYHAIIARAADALKKAEQEA